MANFTNVWPLGAPFQGILESVKVTQLDNDHVKAPNLAEGSSHAPTTPFIVGGAGISLTSESRVADGGELHVQSGGELKSLAGSAVTLEGVTTVTDVTFSGVAIPKLASRQYERRQHGSPQYPSGDWEPVDGHLTSQGVGKDLYIPLDIPDGARINSLRVSIEANSPHVGMPAVLPTIKLYKNSGNLYTRTQIGATGADPSINLAIYEPRHEIYITGLDELVDDASSHYEVVLKAESGANALGAQKYYGTRVFYTATSIPG